MIEMPGFVSGVVRSVGLSTAMKAAGVVTGLLPIPQPMLLVGPGARRRLGLALAGFGHRRILIVTDATIVRMGLLKGFTQALTRAGGEFVVFDAITADAPIPVVEKAIAFYRRRGCDAIVAFGGGSPMDAAKAIAYSVANGKPLAATGVCHTDAYTLSGRDPSGLFPVVLATRAPAKWWTWVRACAAWPWATT